jgi:hypothetical protein
MATATEAVQFSRRQIDEGRRLIGPFDQVSERGSPASAARA